MLNYDCVIIDSGVNLYHSRLKNSNIYGNRIFFDECMNLEIDDDFQDKIGHGTAVYSIIKENSPINSTIYNINIFSDKESIDEDLLISALIFIEKNITCKVINISSGIKLCNRMNELYDVCKRLSNKGVYIISAFDNEGAMSYPAAFDCVLGVDISNRCIKICDYEYVEDSPINIRAKGGTNKVYWTEPEYVIVQGSSFSCAYVTSIVLDKLLNIPNIRKEELHQILKKEAKNVYRSEVYSNEETNSYFIPKNVMIFPVNKEIHSLLAFSSLLPFTISQIADLRVSGNVNKSVKDIISYKKTEDDISFLSVKNIDSIDWNSLFDTIIIGHVSTLSVISKRNLIKELLDKCIFYHKNVIALDDLSEYHEECSILRNNGCLVFSSKKSLFNSFNRFGKLYHINKPIVCIAGTSSSQGKNTLQLYLRERFISYGYKVGQLGSEPTAKLFQMDEMYHYGYSVLNTDHFEKTILSVNTLMKNIERNNPDIILTGIQSGTVPYAFDNIQYLTNRQLEVLIGISPDVVILCINSYDEIEYIKRTIAVIEGFSCAKVICCVLYPLKYNEKLMAFGSKKAMSDSEIKSACNYFSSELLLPVIPQLESKIDSIVDILINYFSE